MTAQATFRGSLPIGSMTATVGPSWVTAGLEGSALPIGAMLAEAGTASTRATLAGSLPIGEARLAAGSRRGVSGAFSLPFGGLNARATCHADMWATAGFPLPKMAGYTYSRPSSILRTKFYSGATRQRRKFSNGWRRGTVAFEIPWSQLNDLEEFISTYGYIWFSMRIVTSDTITRSASLHSVRVIENPEFGELYGANISCTLKIEIVG